MQFIKKNHSQMVIIFFFLSPFLDLITGLNERFAFLPIPFVYLVKMGFLVLTFSYILMMSRGKYRSYVIVYVIAIIGIGCAFLLHNITLGKAAVLFANVQHFVKVFYYPTLLLSFVCIYEREPFPLQDHHFAQILGIYMVLLLLPWFTNTGFDGYSQGKTGNVGWFYSINEIGAILSILLPLLVLQLHQSKWLVGKFVIAGITVLAFFSLGSKTPIFALCIIIACYYIMYLKNLYTLEKKRLFRIYVSLSLLVVAGICFVLPMTSFYKNIEKHVTFLEIDNMEDVVSLRTLDRLVLSDRLTFLNERSKGFMEQPASTLWLGDASYQIKDHLLVQPKTVEIDYFDIFFDFGILGFAGYFIVVLYVWYETFRQRTRRFDDSKVKIYTMILILAYTLAFMSGHVLVAPSVSIFLVAFHILLLQRRKGAIYENSFSNR